MLFRDIRDNAILLHCDVKFGYSPEFKPSWKFVETSTGFHAGIDRTSVEDKHLSSFTIQGTQDEIYDISSLLSDSEVISRTIFIELECLHERIFGLDMKPLISFTEGSLGAYEVVLVNRTPVRRINESFFGFDIELQLITWDTAFDTDTFNALAIDSSKEPLFNVGYNASIETQYNYKVAYESVYNRPFQSANTTTQSKTSYANQAEADANWSSKDMFNGATIDLSMTVNDYWAFDIKSKLYNDRFEFRIGDYIDNAKISIGELYGTYEYTKLLDGMFPVNVSLSNNGFNEWTINMKLKATFPK